MEIFLRDKEGNLPVKLDINRLTEHDVDAHDLNFMIIWKKLLYASCLLFLGSCYEETELPWTRLLTDSTWRLSSWTSSPAFVYTFSDGTQKSFTDLFQLYVPCRHDDEYIFKADPESEGGTSGTYVYREGELACGEEVIREECTWFFSGDTNGMHIYFELPGSEPFNYLIRKIYTIEEVTQNRLVFTYKTQSGYTWREEYLKK